MGISFFMTSLLIRYIAIGVACTVSIFGALTFHSVDIVSIVADPLEDRVSNISTPFFSETEQLESLDTEEVVEDLLANEPYQVRGRILNYPNPFTMDEGTIVGYYLSKAMDVTLKIYDMYGAEIYSEDFKAGENGGYAPDDGYNRIPLDRTSFGGHELTTGVYIYLLLYDGDVLGKGKMAVIQ